MKNINYVINGVLAVAVLILFILQFTGKNNSPSSSGRITASSEESTITMPVAYINVDSLLENYHFSIDLNDNFVRRTENSEASYAQEARRFQTDYENYQFRLRNGAITTQQRAETEERRLQKMQQDLQALQERLTRDLMEENQRMNEQLRDTIMSHLKEYNQTKGYHIIFANTSSSLVSPILLADEAYNITAEVILFLNRKWASLGGN